MTLPPATAQAVQAYAQKHGVNYDEALTILVTQGLLTLGQSASIAMHAHLAVHERLGRTRAVD